jgi:putative membrane protein
MAASSQVFEVQASRLAIERSTSADVRAFAQRLLDAHARSDERLKAVAAAAGVDDAPSGVVAAHGAQLERLRALDGPAFDREFAVQVGVAGHAGAVAVFERTAQRASSAQLREFAGEALPERRDRLTQSLALARAVGVPAERIDAAAAVTDVPAATGATPSTGR